MSKPAPIFPIHTKRELKAKVIKVSANVLTELMKFAVENRVPKDSAVRSVNYTPLSNSFDVIVESNEYEPVIEGSLIPEVSGPPVMSNNFFINRFFDGGISWIVIAQVANMSNLNNATVFGNLHAVPTEDMGE